MPLILKATPSRSGCSRSRRRRTTRTAPGPGPERSAGSPGRDEVDSCLVTSITDPATADFVFCWPLYRRGTDVYVQNAVVFLGELADAFRPTEPWLSVEPRGTVDEDGNEISEWRTTIDEVRAFLSAHP
ncbi:hypothetical protein [Streptomyces venezuelae]